MEMIQNTTQNIDEFIKFLKGAIALLVALCINALYEHTEFILIIAIIFIFAFDLLGIWKRQRMAASQSKL